MSRAFSLSLVVAFVLLSLFVFLNWSTLAAPSVVNLGVADVGGSPGVVLLLFIVAITGLFTLYIAALQAGVILEARRLTKEVKAQRDLADTAEASRFTELRAALDAGLQRIELRVAESGQEFGGRVAGSGRELQEKLEESTGSLSAYLGEIDDKLDRVLITGSTALRPAAGLRPAADS